MAKIFLNVTWTLINIVFSNIVIVIEFYISSLCVAVFGYITASVECLLSLRADVAILWSGSEIPLPLLGHQWQHVTFLLSCFYTSRFLVSVPAVPLNYLSLLLTDHISCR